MNPTPDAGSPYDEAIARVVERLRGARLAILTGAGVSTDSGIPDYRGPETRHLPRTPIQHAAFVRSPEVRARYFARSFVGYPRLADARPNATHHALAALAASARSTGLVTQNVDGLHAAAGTTDAIELHGSLHRVVCLDCGARSARNELQARLAAANPGFSASGERRADGDVALDDASVARFVVPACTTCGGVLSPDVVFFGGSVPRDRVGEVESRVDAADALLVVGSSLTVYSGYRFARLAHAQGKPVVVVTLGESRADALAAARLDAPVAEVVPALVRALR